MNKNVLVTGGAGFIGSHVVDLLLNKGYKVTVIDDLSAGRKDNVPDNVTLKIKKITMMEKEDIESFDVVIHCAAQVSTFYSVEYPEKDFENNAHSTFHLFELCRKYNDDALIVFTSSRSVHGNIPEPLLANEDFPYNPSTFYNAHKIYGEILCKIYKELYGMKFIVLRPSNVYGPRQPYWMSGWYNFIAYWIKLALENKPIPIYGTGDQIRDYTYVEDTARAYVLAIENKAAIGETFLLPTGRGVSLNQLSDIIIELTGSKSIKQYLPPRKGDIMRFVGSYKKAKEILNWEPLVSLEEGLKKEIEWVKKDLQHNFSQQNL
jgi:UDP-glucose 4-epimerase